MKDFNELKAKYAELERKLESKYAELERKHQRLLNAVLNANKGS